MKKEELLLSKLKAYGETDQYPFHMPGHKRRTDTESLCCFSNPFSIDITEIDGFDNLHHPEGILKTSMDWAAKVYGTKRSYYLINGSSGGILSVISASVRPGGRILVSRNCHKAVYHGAILNHLNVSYVYPQILDELWIQGGISPDDVEKALCDYPDIEAVLIVSPTYDGIVSDIRTIANIVHLRGIPFIVDEAHGAHFSFGAGNFPESALYQGADVVIQSLHKTLPSLTQTAILHWQGPYLDRRRLEQFLQIYQTSSPSYVFMASIESCIDQMERVGAKNMKEFKGRIDRERKTLEKLHHLTLLSEHCIGKAAIVDLDPSKFVIFCQNVCKKEASLMTGEMLSRELRERFGLEMELAGPNYVTAITTFLDTSRGLERLSEALLHIDSELECTSERNMLCRGDFEHAEVVCTPAEAIWQEQEPLLLESCAGRVSGEFIYLYPPGIPLVAPGEKISEMMIMQIKDYQRAGLPVQGMEDRKGQYLKVICQKGRKDGEGILSDGKECIRKRYDI